MIPTEDMVDAAICGAVDDEGHISVSRAVRAVMALIEESRSASPAEIEFNQKLKFVLENLAAIASLYDRCKNKKLNIKYHDDDLVSVHLGDLRKASVLLTYIQSAAVPVSPAEIGEIAKRLDRIRREVTFRHSDREYVFSANQMRELDATATALLAYVKSTASPKVTTP